MDGENPRRERMEIMEMNRKIYRSNQDRMLCGVCGGIGEYLNVDATIIRLVWVLLACSGTGLLAYFVAAIIIPRDPVV